MTLDSDLKKQVDTMSHEEMADRWRFSPPGDPFFQGEIGKYFCKVFKQKGGMTPEVSKAIGWKKAAKE